MIEILDFEPDIDRVIEELRCILNTDHFLGQIPDQVCIQTVEGKDYLYGARGGNEFEEDESDFNVFYWPMPYINSILEGVGLVRSRMMNLKSKTCLSYHKDPTVRFHMPVITNESCFIIIDKEVHHLPVGKCYIIDSTLPHTAVNASFEDRIHIIGTVEHSYHTA